MMRNWQSCKVAVFTDTGHCDQCGRWREFLREQVVDPSSPFNLMVRAT